VSTHPEAPVRQEVPSARGPVRSAVYGTVIAMSVMAYLGDHEPAPGIAALTVACTGIVIGLAEAYAGLLAGALADGTRVGVSDVRHELRESAYAAAPGVVAGVVLLVTALVGLGIATRIDITLWAGVAALGVFGGLAGRTRRRTTTRVVWTVASLALGVTIVLLKAALH
jgi:hypothetical protein